METVDPTKRKLLVRRYKMILVSALVFGVLFLIFVAVEQVKLATVCGLVYLGHGFLCYVLKCPNCKKEVLKMKDLPIYTIWLPKKCRNCGEIIWGETSANDCKNEPQSNKTRDQIAGTGGATD
ncbi:MAG: hypothetical protein KJT03_15675, partial [Verrucomicrobiae bacterium]|nr:hypothetical protein [Verrucomicrobiae bacterium]